MPRQIIGYARVNVGDQLHLDRQIAQLQALGAVEVLTDIQSGMSQDRPSLNRLIRMIQTDQVEAVVVTRVDRISRSSTQLGQFLNVCQGGDVEIRVLTQSLSCLSTKYVEVISSYLALHK